MHILMFYHPLSLTVVISSLFSLALNLPLVEHTGFVQIPPHDDAYYFLRVYPEFPNPLLIWLGHTPGHPINYQSNDSAVPPFKNELNVLMIDLPGIGKTKSSRTVSLDSLTSFLRMSIAYVKQRYANYSFSEVLIGGEKYMTPLAISLAEALTASNTNVTSLVLGNPYLEGRLSMPRRFQIVKHFGFLDIEKEDQFSFLNDLCMKNTTLAGCSRIDKLFDIVTNKSEHLTEWSEKYLNSVLSKTDYLSDLISLLRSQKYKILLYTGQLDLNSGFQRVYSVLQHFAVCDPPEPYTYYIHEDSVKGFYKQNTCWTLLEVYNSSANVTHSQAETVGSAISEFIDKGRLDSLKGGDMEKEIQQYMPNCTLQDWTTGKYHCNCNNGKYGVNCSVEVETKDEAGIYKEHLNKNKVAYTKFIVTGPGYLLLEKNIENCTIDIYANLYSENGNLELPTDQLHDIHTRTGKIHVSVEHTIVMLKFHSACDDVVSISLKYYKEKTYNILLYGLLTGGLGLVIILLIVAMVLVHRKICHKRDPNSLLEITNSSTT